MKNSELMKVNELLTTTDFNSILNGKFQYAIQKNIARLEPEMKLMQKAIDALKHEEYKTIHEEGLAWVKENPDVPEKDWEKYAEFHTEADIFKKVVDEFLEGETSFEFH